MSDNNSFWVQYHVKALDQADAESKAELIAIEQSVEMPPEVVPPSARHNIGSVLEVLHHYSDIWSVKISFQSSLFESDLTQFLNVLFGNISLQPWCKLINVETAGLETSFQGPAFGIPGIRKLLHIPERAVSCAVIKPIGTSSSKLADMAGKFASGGIDIIKDDHGLTNQSSAPFKQRVKKCLQAVKKGQQVSGKRSLYFPNITTSPLKIRGNFEFAIEAGADGVLVAPQLVGLETLHELAKQHSVPLMAHPSFSGSYLVNPGGIDPSFYFGKLTRSLGADIIIYPNAGGRFGFSTETCQAINQACRFQLGNFLPAFPAPGGGVRLETISYLVQSYGNDTLFLIGGSLYKQGDIKDAARQFQNILNSYE